MTALELLQDTRRIMIECDLSLVNALRGAWEEDWKQGHFSVEPVLAACVALWAYCDPFDTDTTDTRLYGRLVRWQVTASRATQLDAVDFAIDFLGGRP